MNKTSNILKAMQQSTNLRGFQIIKSSIKNNRVRFVLCCVGHAIEQAKTLRACSMNVKQRGCFLSVRYSTRKELSMMQ